MRKLVASMLMALDGVVENPEWSAQFMQEDLIDEYRLLVFPIVIGNGKQLFHGVSQHKEFKLIHSHTFGSGVVVLIYEPYRK